MYKSLRMAHEKIFLCVKRTYTGMDDIFCNSINFSNVDGRLQRFHILRLFHKCIFNVCGKSIMKVFPIICTG